MSIYVAKHFTVHAAGTRVRDVWCDRCKTQYHYHLAREAKGQSSAPYYLFQAAAEARAHRNAADELQKRLTRDSEPVPCPACGWVNERLVRDHRGRAYRWLSAVAAVGGIGAFAGTIFARSLQRQPIRDDEWPTLLIVAGGLAFAIVVGSLLAQWRLRRGFDPNRSFPNAPAVPIGTPLGWAEGDAPLPVGAITTDSTRGIDADAVVFRLGTLALPEHCCVCLGPPDRLFKLPFSSGSVGDKLPVPICDACMRRLRGQWVRLTLAMTAGFGCLAFVGYVITGGPFEARIATATLVMIAACPLTVALVPPWWVRPWRFRTIDKSRSLARVRFRNVDYAALTRAAMEAT